MNDKPKKIVIIGPESTGKSTLTESLAQHFKTASVPEYAREYLQQKNAPYQYNDLLEIARGQLEAEDRISKYVQNACLFCDTDLYVIKVWSEHKYQRCDPFILKAIARRHYDYYLLTDIDLIWAEDPLREYPQPEMRRYFFHIYQDIVQNSGRPWALIKGSREARLEQAIAALTFYLEEIGNVQDPQNRFSS